MKNTTPEILRRTRGRGTAFSEGFKMIDVGSHKEPMPDDLYATYILPDTSIKAGIFDYETDVAGDVRRLGFLVDSKKFFYVNSEEYNLDDVHYGLVGNYFVVDGWGWGSTSGHDRLMLLCQFDKTSVKLLDVIGEIADRNLGILDFTSVTNDKRDSWKIQKNSVPPLMEIQDVDHDGIPEIKLWVAGDDFYLYMEIIDGHFRVNFNPDLYALLFDKEKQKLSDSKRKRKSNAYYFYGYLSKKMDIRDIKFERGNVAKDSVVRLLENVGNWDTSFHNQDEAHFVMKQLELKGN
jgi:hypothetical protein